MYNYNYDHSQHIKHMVYKFLANHPIKMTLAKSSGNAYSGYGIIFCQQKYENSDFLLTVMINNMGQYLIGKYYRNTFSIISEWKESNSLLKGTGVNNEIEISDEDNVFYVKLNGTVADSFSVQESINVENSKYGYVVVISNDENFPDVPVSVVFMISTTQE